MEYLANILQERFAEPIADTKWLGAFTFKNLLKKADLKGLKVSPVDQGYVYDPLRHQQPVQDPLKDNSFYLKYPEIEPLAKKINKLTDTPILLPEQYRLLFDEIVRAVKETGFYVTGTSEIVSNRCIEKGAPVSKEHVVFVIGNLKSSNYPYERGRESAEKMSKAFAQLVIRLCRSVQFVLKMEEQELVWAWITGSDSLQGSAKEDTEKNQSERLS
jgi:hypothetical protein